MALYKIWEHKNVEGKNRRVGLRESFGISNTNLLVYFRWVNRSFFGVSLSVLGFPF